METIYVELIDSTAKIPFNLSYGVHKELQELLMKDDNLFRLLVDTDLSEEVLQIALSERNEKGQIIKEFSEAGLVTAESVNLLLEYIFDYFSEFFLKNQKRVKNLSDQIAQISAPSQGS